MRIGGVISAFPVVIGPVLLITAQNRGAVFAARAANGTLLGLTALAAFALSYSWVASHARWRASLACAWASAALLSALIGRSATGLGFPAGLGIAVVSLAFAYTAMPSSATGAVIDHSLVSHRAGIAARMVVTVSLVALLAATAEVFGPVIGGMLAGLPVLASVLAVCTHRRDGSVAVVDLLRGMLSGMAGFVAFCAVVATLIVPTGTAVAFAAATVAAAGLQALALARRPPLLRHGLRRAGHQGPPVACRAPAQ